MFSSLMAQVMWVADLLIHSIATGAFLIVVITSDSPLMAGMIFRNNLVSLF